LRMLALRNLNWMSGTKVMYLMSGVYLAAATIGAVGRGVKEIDEEIVTGFAAVFGVPVGLLDSLTGRRVSDSASIADPPPRIVDTASLLLEVRYLTAEQIGEVSREENLSPMGGER